MKIAMLVLAGLLAGCAAPAVVPTSQNFSVPQVQGPMPFPANTDGNCWEQIPATGSTYRMRVRNGYIYLYWDPPKPNTMVFVPDQTE